MGRENSVDEYIANTIKQGDKGSKLLASLVAPTLKNPLVDIVSQGMNGIAVLRPPKNSLIVVHSMGGDPKETNLPKYVKSLVDRLVQGSRNVGATPIGFGDVVDASSMNLDMISIIGNELRKNADFYHLPIMNGELADLGARVNCPANLSGTMISAISKDHILGRSVGSIFQHELNYAIIDPKGDAVFINCDGIGTKTEFYERWMDLNLKQLSVMMDFLGASYEDYIEELPCGVEDFAAMNVDDSGKLAAAVRVLSGVIETKGKIPVGMIEDKLRLVTEKFDVLGILQHEDLGDRLRGYTDNSDSYNISGSAVSTIDEDRLHNLPKPQEGNYLIAIKGVSNPRSNGITAKRKVMVNLFGENWHQTEEGKLFLPYLAQHSTILYPTFKKLFDEGLATSVFHNSGGAYNGKLARPLAKHGLYVDLKDNLFAPDWREVTLAAYSLSVQDAYEKWPMGTDGFVATNNPDEAIKLIRSQGLEAKLVGRLQKAETDYECGPMTGVKLTAFNGQEIYFSGMD